MEDDKRKKIIEIIKTMDSKKLDQMLVILLENSPNFYIDDKK